MFDEADRFTTALFLQGGCTKGRFEISTQREGKAFQILLTTDTDVLFQEGTEILNRLMSTKAICTE